MQVPDAAEAVRIPSSNVNTALDKVRDGSADAAMVPIENSVEGGVTATLDAHRHRPGTADHPRGPRAHQLRAGGPAGRADRRDPRGFHPRPRLGPVPAVGERPTFPDAEYIPGSSTAAAAMGLLDGRRALRRRHLCADSRRRATRTEVLAENIGDNPGGGDAVRAGRAPGRAAGADRRRQDHRGGPPARGPAGRADGDPGPVRHPRRKPEPDRVPAHRAVPGATTSSASTPTATSRDARVADALAGLHRISPATRFLGSYRPGRRPARRGARRTPPTRHSAPRMHG